MMNEAQYAELGRTVMHFVRAVGYESGGGSLSYVLELLDGKIPCDWETAKTALEQMGWRVDAEGKMEFHR